MLIRNDIIIRMNKTIFTTTEGRNIAVLLDVVKNASELVFIMPGLKGYKEEPYMETYAQAFIEKGITAVRFDTSNGLGETDGNFEDTTVTQYYKDLEDVIAWAKTQPWYKEPFYLLGHSLGSITTMLYAAKQPHKIKGIVPTSCVVSGELTTKTPRYKEGELKEWETTGWHKEMFEGKEMRLKWKHMADRCSYDLLPLAASYKLPILLIVGELDITTPVAHQQLLFDKLNCPKKLYIIKGAGHAFKEPEHLQEVKETIMEWLEETF